MPSTAGVTFGLSQDSSARLRDILGRFVSLQGELRVGTEMEVKHLAEELEKALKDEFTKMPVPNKAGRTTHDRTGTDDDRSAWDASYVHTIDTITVKTDGLEATVSMGGAAGFVEYGTRAHVIEAKNGPYLTFKGSEGWARKESVENPGYAGDDFVGRAIADIDLPKFLNKLMTHIRIEQWGHAESATGKSYGSISTSSIG